MRSQVPWRAPWRFSRAEIRIQAISVAAVCAVLVGMHLASSASESDFTHFYTLGKVAAAKDAKTLYDSVWQDQLYRRVIPNPPTGWFLPVHPPQVALVFALPSALPYTAAALAWAGLCLISYLAFVIALGRGMARFSVGELLLLSLAFAPFWQLMRYLQATPVLFCALVIAWTGFARKRLFLAGLGIGLLAVKPHYAIVPAFVMLASGEWPVVLGALSSVAVQAACGAAWFGPSVLRDYMHAVAAVPAYSHLLDAQPEHLHSLSGFFQLLMPRATAWLPTAVVGSGVALICLRSWRSSASLAVRFACLVLGIVLVSPHVMIYDVTLIAPSLLAISDWASQTDGGPTVLIDALVYAVYVALLVPFAQLHVQLSVPLIAAILVIAARARAVTPVASTTLARQAASQNPGEVRSPKDAGGGTAQ